MPKNFVWFLPFAVSVTVLAGTVCAAFQGVLRLSANDPQIQIAEDATALLAVGAAPAAIVSDTLTDVKKSLAPFIIIYDATGQPIASSAELSGRVPIPPKGVFNYTKINGEDRVTWQPEPAVRLATVVRYFGGPSLLSGEAKEGFVLAGRSLREVEKRESQLASLVLGGWLATLLAGFVSLISVRFLFERKNP